MTQDRLAVTVHEAKKMVSLGKTKIHQMLADGRLTRVKVDRRTLVTIESLRRLIEEQR